MTTPTPQPSPSLSLRASLARITIGGCMGISFFTILGSPAQTQFFQAIGADELFFGLLSGIPMLALLLQFPGAALANSVHSRKPIFIWLNIVARSLMLFVAALPLLLPGASRTSMLWAILVILTLSSALQNTGGPMWYSWMADLIPGRLLNRYWGHRQQWLMVSWLVAYVGVAAFTFAVDLPIRTTFLLLTIIAVALGVADISLFFGVREPRNTVTTDRPVMAMALEPFRHADFKTFILFWCVWVFCASFAMVFMQYYVLKELHFTVWQTTIVFCTIGIGNALTAGYWGRIADKRGHKPVLSLCLQFKPIIVLAFCFATPANALWLLPAMFLFDALWNAGIDISANGYMMKFAPRENRSMYVATITGLAGLCGGLGAIAGGAFLSASSGISWNLFGREWTNYHLFFLIGALLRVGAGQMVRLVREPSSDGHVVVVTDVLGDWQTSLSRVPIGLFRMVRRVARLE